MLPFRAGPSRNALPVIALVLAGALAAPALPAQEAGEPAPDPPRSAQERMTQEIIEVEHADLNGLRRVLGAFGVDVTAHPELGLLTIRGWPQDVAAATAAVQRLDVPPEPVPGIELTAYILGASRTETLDGSVPAELEPVAEQLRNLFGFQGVDLVDTLLVRVSDGGEGMVRGVLSGAAAGVPYRLGINEARLVEGRNEVSVRLDGLLFEAKTPSGAEAQPVEPDEAKTQYRKEFLTSLITDVDVRVGQKTVVGKAATSGARDGLILVLEARVLD